VPRVQSRDLQYRSFTRWYGTLNDNRDSDSGFALELALSWRSLKMDPARQKAVRFDIGNVDLDTNDFRDPETWRSAYYSEYLYGDRSFDKSPGAWVVLNLNPLPLKGPPEGGKEGKIPLFIWVLALFGAALLAVFLALYYRRINAINEEMKNQVLVRLQQYLQEHFREKITLEDFCRVYNYPDKRVQRIFRNHYDATFANVILQKRMEEAKRLLETTDKNVTEVCFEVGFNDASYFTKSFKAFFGLLPKDVKKSRGT
jgi:AraC-like DNA-binding protein